MAIESERERDRVSERMNYDYHYNVNDDEFIWGCNINAQTKKKIKSVKKKL